MFSNARMVTLVLFVMAALLIAGCSPASTFQALSMGGSMSDGDMATDEMAEDGGEMEGESMEDESEEAMDSSEMMPMEGDGATATIATRSLRVRSEPNAESEVVYGVSEGEVYAVLGLSDDGQWVQLALPESEAGSGWVSSNFVTVSGALEGSTGEALILQPTPVPSEEMASEEPTDDAMAESDDDAMAETDDDTMAEAEDGAMAETEDDAMEGEDAGPPPAPEAGYATVYTDGTRLRVRAEPNTESEIVGYVYNGETYEVIGASDDGAWLNLGGVADSDNPDGGWVAIAYLVPGQ